MAQKDQRVFKSSIFMPSKNYYAKKEMINQKTVVNLK